MSRDIEPWESEPFNILFDIHCFKHIECSNWYGGKQETSFYYNISNNISNYNPSTMTEKVDLSVYNLDSINDIEIIDSLRVDNINLSYEFDHKSGILNIFWKFHRKLTSTQKQIRIRCRSKALYREKIINEVLNETDIDW